MQTGTFGVAVLGLLVSLVPGNVGAQEFKRPAPPRARLANVNLLMFGVGQAAFSHPTFGGHGYPTFAYQRRILRREIRPLPIWVRGAFQYLSDKSRCEKCYKVWGSYDAGIALGPERVSESTTDFALRAETLADVLHTPHSALYGGVGFVLHSLNFTSHGAISAGTDENLPTEALLSPSTFFGLRVFSASRTYTGYTELRYGRVFGKTDDLQGNLFLTQQTFAFKGTNAAFLEAGLGLHW